MNKTSDQKALSKTEKMEALRRELEVLAGQEPDHESSEEEIEIKKKTPRGKKQEVAFDTPAKNSACGALPADEEPSETQPETKPKRPRTPKQIEAFKRAQEKNKVLAEQRRILRERAEVQAKEEAEKELIEKAIKVKKKQIKKMAVLQEFSDDDTPIEKLPRLKRPEPVSIPLFRFV